MKLLTTSILSILVHVPLSLALGAGEFCFFLAPTEAFGLGHIAWGFEIPGTTNGKLNVYQFGGTEDVTRSSVWTRQGSRADMLNTFKHVAGPVQNKYETYKCLHSSTSAVGGAEKVVQFQQTSANVYNAVTNNCLHQSLNIAQAYAETDVYDYIWNVIAMQGSNVAASAAFIPNDFWPWVFAPEIHL